MQTLNPVLLTEQATRKLPRSLLFCMALAYAFSGLLGRDPWRGEDAQGFGIALSLAQGAPLDQGILQIAGAAVAQEGPLWFAIVALFIKGLSFLPAHVAAYVPLGCVILLSLLAVWYATYYAARTPAAQPLPLALGGQPKPIAYGCAVADGAVLICLATLGIALKLHELSSVAAQFLLHCLLLLSMSMALYKPKIALRLAMFVLFALGANRGLPGIVPALTWLLILSLHPAWSHLKKWRLFLILSATLGAFTPLLLAWSLANPDYGLNLLWWNLHAFGFAGWSKTWYFFSNLAAIGWPAIPFALAAIWRWRGQVRAPHIWLGCSYLVVMLIGVLFQSNLTEASFLSVLPGAFVLAAFLLPALPRVWMNGLDWFGVMALTFACGVVWLAWLVLSFAWPSQAHQSIMRLSPGFDTRINAIALLVALLASGFWWFVVHWRTTRASTAVWRAAVVWSAGTLTVWILLGSLWMPWVNHGKSYRTVALELKTALSDHTQCVSPLRLGLPQRAVLSYFGELRFEKLSSAPTSETPAEVACNWLLEYDSLQALSGLERLPYLPEGHWGLVWEGRRFTDKDERFRLYQRTSKP